MIDPNNDIDLEGKEWSFLSKSSLQCDSHSQTPSHKDHLSEWLSTGGVPSHVWKCHFSVWLYKQLWTTKHDRALKILSDVFLYFYLNRDPIVLSNERFLQCSNCHNDVICSCPQKDFHQAASCMTHKYVFQFSVTYAIISIHQLSSVDKKLCCIKIDMLQLVKFNYCPKNGKI